MHLNRAWILRHIPHQGRMCLLDEVVSWDAGRISCRGASHRAADNPLRVGGQLGIACGIEYAAQAMALHGALAAGAADGWPGGGNRGDDSLGPGTLGIVAQSAGSVGRDSAVAGSAGGGSAGGGSAVTGSLGVGTPAADTSGAAAADPGTTCAAAAAAGRSGAAAVDPGTPGAGALGAAAPAAGYLAGVRGVEFHVLRLDELPGDLLCEAVKVAGDGATALYEFELRSGTKRLLRGRATVLLDARERIHL